MTLSFSDLNFNVSTGISGGGEDANFLPAGTVINVKADGTGDFATIADAVTYLVGKWSNGIVTIQLGTGTFNITSTVSIDGANYNIPCLRIVGNGINNTIIENNITSSEKSVFSVENIANGLLSITNLTIRHTGETVSTTYRGITFNFGSTGYVKNLAFSGITVCVRAMNNSSIRLSGSFEFTNCGDCVLSNTSNLTTESGTSLAFNTCNLAFNAYNGGQIHGYGTTYTYTDVTTKTNISVGTATNTGWITGVTL